MASQQVMLVLFCGEIWSCLCAAAPQHAARTESHTCSTATSPSADRPPLHQLQAAVPTPLQSDRARAATEPQAFPGEEEAGDGSWVAALLLGSILIGMTLAIIVILLWKCCVRPPPAQCHWAGRSPFVDGDTSDLFTDPDPGTKRSSVLFMLPWRLKQGTNLQEDPSVSENPPQHTPTTENGQPPPPATGCSGAGSAPAPAPASEQEPATAAADSCPPPDTPPECSDLPPPPDWLREPAEEPSSDPSKHSALHLEAEEPQPSPPELLIQEIHETLPQPEHPL
ncbi:protein EVI2B [Pyrgilauda ruficollis]|uniref:protein EVI2B n=1 Tax=Pyrgilauda ruficollis TaxID=221976 RepID=UPI001B88587C|nr:protein EVI2B [Pyrgilauda ruficollis]XP_041338846.1 protein EVI2B [Pyrgilauda ruficollis]